MGIGRPGQPGPYAVRLVSEETSIGAESARTQPLCTMEPSAQEMMCSGRTVAPMSLVQVSLSSIMTCKLVDTRFVHYK